MYDKLARKQLLRLNLPSQGSQPLRILPPPFNVDIDAHIVSPVDTDITPGGNAIQVHGIIRDMNSVLPKTMSVLLSSSCKNSIQSLTLLNIFGANSNRNDTISIGGGTFDDRTRPSGDELIGDMRDIRGDTFAFCIENDETA